MTTLKNFITHCPNTPGIYKMLGTNRNILYIGKAKSLKARLKSYLNPMLLSARIIKMLNQLEHVEITSTTDETEALLLESKLIKQHKPKYNILLKDNKSFPYICIDETSEFPRVFKHRGAKVAKHTYYGPFTSAKKVNETLSTLQKIFPLRSCTNSYFKNRTRPCILYQIKRCSGPCANKINKADYKDLVAQIKNFLSGKTKAIQAQLASRMKGLSINLEYEKAALYRDRIESLSFIQAQTHATPYNNIQSADVICFVATPQVSAIQISFIRNGNHLGNKVYHFPDLDEQDAEECLTNFITKFYRDNIPPHEVLLNHKLQDHVTLAAFLHTLHKHKTKITTPKYGTKLNLITHSESILNNSLQAKLLTKEKHATYFTLLQQYFNLSKLDRIEVYDNSHISGADALGVMVAFDRNGLIKSDYRKYYIKTTQNTQDDYAMLREVLSRRLKSPLPLPDMVIIDGGKGQLSAASKVLKDHALDHVYLISMAKGKDRNSGNEVIHTTDRTKIHLNKHNKTKQFLQNLRDEAHRFAITSHRKKRERIMLNSPIETIGKARAQQLLSIFGSLENLKSASIKDLQKIKGIGEKIAENIYKHLHNHS